MVRTRLSSESPKDEESDSKANKVGLSEKAQWQPTAGVFTGNTVQAEGKRKERADFS